MFIAQWQCTVRLSPDDIIKRNTRPIYESFRSGCESSITKHKETLLSIPVHQNNSTCHFRKTSQTKKTTLFLVVHKVRLNVPTKSHPCQDRTNPIANAASSSLIRKRTPFAFSTILSINRHNNHAILLRRHFLPQRRLHRNEPARPHLDAHAQRRAPPWRRQPAIPEGAGGAQSQDC